MQVLTPIIFIKDKLSGFLLKLLHIDSSKRAMMTETELKTYVDVSHEDGVIEQEEKKIIEGSKRKQLVKTERTIVRKDIKEIKDVVKFWTGKTDKVNNQ